MEGSSGKVLHHWGLGVSKGVDEAIDRMGVGLIPFQDYSPTVTTPDTPFGATQSKITSTRILPKNREKRIPAERSVRLF